MSMTTNTNERIWGLEREIAARFRNHATAFGPDVYAAKSLNNPFEVLFTCGGVLDLLASEAAKAEIGVEKARREQGAFKDRCRAAASDHDEKLARAKSKREMESLGKAWMRSLADMAEWAAFYEGQVSKALGTSAALINAAQAVADAANKRIADALKNALLPEGAHAARGYLVTAK